MEYRTVIFEDNDLLRKSLISLLDNEDGYKVVADFADGLNAEENLKNINPELIILDIDMPGRTGLDMISSTKELFPLAKIIMYTQFEDDDKIFTSICSGADGYILKKTSPFNLISAIHEISEGGAPMSPKIAKKVLASFRKKNSPKKVQYDLTKRELEVLKYLIEGHSIKIIASKLNIAYETCKSHLKNIYTKLHVNCGKEAIVKVLSEKIL